MGNTGNPDTTPQEPTPDEGNTGGTGDQLSTQKTDGTQTKDWAAAYKGLQSAYNKLQTKMDKLQEQYDAASSQSEEHLQGKSAAEKQLKTLGEEMETLKQQISTLDGEKTAAEAKIERSRLIMSEFPELAEFEAKGLIPNADTPEAQRTIFEQFKETLGGRIDTTVQSKMAGASPPGTSTTSTSSPPPEESEEVLWRTMMKTAGVPGKQEEYQAAQEKYDALQEKKSQ